MKAFWLMVGLVSFSCGAALFAPWPLLITRWSLLLSAAIMLSGTLYCSKLERRIIIPLSVLCWASALINLARVGP